MMALNLRIFLIVCILVYLGIIFNMLRKDKLELKYTLIWLLFGLISLIVVIFPDIIYDLSDFLGIVDAVHSVFVIEGMFALVIILSLTSIVSHLNRQNRRLIQSVALLEKRVRELEENDEDYIERDQLAVNS